jgi:hypothetical protein
LGFHWTFTPDYSLARILAQPPQPFPPLDQQAYSCINANLSPPTTGATCTLDKQPTVGLRCEYENLTDLSTFAFDLENPTGPVQTNCGALSGFAATENQLIAELGDAGFIDALYQNVMTVTNSALSSVTGDIPNLIGDVAVGVTQQVSGVGIDLFEGLIGNALWSVGDEGGVLATILGVALEAAIDQDKISETETFQNAADKIYTNYDSLFATLLSEATDQQTAILGDWGEMQAVAALTQSTQLNSLFWTPNLTSQLEIYLPKTLDVSFMKILMPTRFQLCSINYSSVNSLTTTFIQFPSYGPGFVNELDVAFNSPGNGVFNLYDMQTIADCQNNTSPTYPIQNALDQDLFANGVSPYDLFTGNNGWGGVFQATTNPTDLIDADDLANQGCDAMTSTIQNQTATTLAYNVNNTHGYLLTANASSQGNGPISGTIPPYGTLTVASIVGAGITDDYQLSSGGQQIAGFSLNMDNCQTRLKGQTPFISDSTSSNGFEVKTTQITRGLFNTTPGLATVAIYNPSATQ